MISSRLAKIQEKTINQQSALTFVSLTVSPSEQSSSLPVSGPVFTT